MVPSTTKCKARFLSAFMVLWSTSFSAVAGEIAITELPEFDVEASLLGESKLVVKAQMGVDQETLTNVIQSMGATGLKPLFNSTPAVNVLRRRALVQSGRAPIATERFYEVELDGATWAERVDLANALHAHATSEYAWISASYRTPGDIGQPTPDLAPLQDYLEIDPGISSNFANQLGYTGSTVRITDIEYRWITSHEDIGDDRVLRETGQSPATADESYALRYHGTAVIGMLIAEDNAYGITGAVPDAQMAVYTELSLEEGTRRPAAILEAAAASQPGDIILLEMQATISSNQEYGPAELDPVVFEAVQTATDAGVLVVAAAGNGSQDLDSGWYATNYMTWGDSGAIIVGGGSPTTSHARASFSTFGERVDVHAWGSQIFTLGYGGYAAYDSDPNQSYTADFGGTSGASPMVVSVAALIQDYVKINEDRVLSPQQMRDLLIGTGIHSQSSDEIGPFPNMAAAILEIDNDLDGALSPDWAGTDCDEGDARVYPHATAWPKNGVNEDCRAPQGCTHSNPRLPLWVLWGLAGLRRKKRTTRRPT